MPYNVPKFTEYRDIHLQVDPKGDKEMIGTDVFTDHVGRLTEKQLLQLGSASGWIWKADREQAHDTAPMTLESSRGSLTSPASQGQTETMRFAAKVKAGRVQGGNEMLYNDSSRFYLLPFQNTAARQVAKLSASLASSAGSWGGSGTPVPPKSLQEIMKKARETWNSANQATNSFKDYKRNKPSESLSVEQATDIDNTIGQRERSSLGAFMYAAKEALTRGSSEQAVEGAVALQKADAFLAFVEEMYGKDENTKRTLATLFSSPDWSLHNPGQPNSSSKGVFTFWNRNGDVREIKVKSDAPSAEAMVI